MPKNPNANRWAIIWTINGATHVKDFGNEEKARKEFAEQGLTFRVTRVELWDRKEFESLGVKGSSLVGRADHVIKA